MALADIRHEVVLALAQTHDAQHEAQALLARGEDSQKVVAAGELDFLARQDARLNRRLAEIDRRTAERRTTFAWAGSISRFRCFASPTLRYPYTLPSAIRPSAAFAFFCSRVFFETDSA